MKIAHIITRLIIGGAQENTLLTCEGLVEAGHEVYLILGPETGPEGALMAHSEKPCGEVIEVNSMRRAVNPILDRRAYRDLTRLLKELNCDVVHTHSSKAGILGRMAAANARTPVVVHTIHGMSFNRTQSPLKYRLFRGLERYAAKKTNKIVTVADAMIRQSVDAGVGPESLFQTVYSGMRTDLFGPDEGCRRRMRTEWGVPDDAVVFGTIARLFTNKGYEDLLDAMPAMVERIPNAHFVWIGDGPHRELYESRLRAMGLRDRVHLTGLVPPDTIPSLLSGVDVLVHLSRWEGLPRAVVQALLTEVPVISTNIDGAPEVVIPEQTGALVEPGDVPAIIEAATSMASDPQWRQEAGQRGRSRCLEQFDWRRMVEQLEALYNDLLGKVR